MTQAKFTGEVYVKEFTKAERAASRAARAAARPAKRSARKFANSVHRGSKKLAAMLSEDRKRAYLATYTEARKAERRVRRSGGKYQYPSLAVSDLVEAV